MKIKAKFINLDHNSSDSLTADKIPFNANLSMADTVANPMSVVIDGTNVIDWDDGKYFSKSINTNTTFTFSNIKQGIEIYIDIISTSSATITLPNTVTILAGNLTSNARNIIRISPNNGSTEQFVYISVIV